MCGYEETKLNKAMLREKREFLTVEDILQELNQWCSEVLQT